MVLRFGERANFIYQVSAKKFLVIHLSIRQLASYLFASKRQWYPWALGYVASSSLKRNRNLRKRSLITPSSRSPTRLRGLKSRDRKSTRLNPVTNAHLVCRLLLEQTKKQTNEQHKN